MNCPKCGNELTYKTYNDYYNPGTNETYRVYCDHHVCDKCKYRDLPYEAHWGILLMNEMEKKWGELIISKIKSFRDIEKNFISRAEVIKKINSLDDSYIKNCNKDENKKGLKMTFDKWCIHFVLFGKKYYLKKSVEKYISSCGNGLFDLKKEGF